MIVMMIASTASLNASSRLVVMGVSLESDGCRSRRLPRHRERVSCSGGQDRPAGGVRPAVRGCPGLALCRRGAWPTGRVFTHYQDANLRLRFLCTYSIATAPGRSRTRDHQAAGDAAAETSGGSPGGPETSAPPALRRAPSTWLGLRQAQSLKARHREHLIGTARASGESPCAQP